MTAVAGWKLAVQTVQTSAKSKYWGSQKSIKKFENNCNIVKSLSDAQTPLVNLTRAGGFYFPNSASSAVNCPGEMLTDVAVILIR